MDIKVWGPQCWGFLHASSFAYPIRPNKKQKSAALYFIRSIPWMLPCNDCKMHAFEYIYKGQCAIKNHNSEFLRSRFTFSKWMFDFHQDVNFRLKKQNYIANYSQVEAIYADATHICGKNGCNLKMSPTLLSRKYNIHPENTEQLNNISSIISKYTILILSILCILTMANR